MEENKTETKERAEVKTVYVERMPTEFVIFVGVLWCAGFIIACVLIAFALNDKLKVLEV